MRKKIILVVFNETFWGKGLIYSQNLRPLKRIADQTPDASLELYSFTSLFLYFLRYRKIKDGIEALEKEGIKTTIFPVLFYPTRYMVVNAFWMPFFLLNVLPYMIYITCKDKKSKDKIIYSLRSYLPSWAFTKFYKGLGRLVFDTRTDWIDEAKSVGYWKPGSLSDRMWLSNEIKMFERSDRVLFISEAQRDDALKRTGVKPDSSKYVIFYNQVDFNRFENNIPIERPFNFLYTGSLGHWNNIELYLDFFKSIQQYFPLSRLIIATPTSKKKIEKSLYNESYSAIRSDVELHYNVPFNELPDLYARCRYGLQLMNKPDSRVGVKFVEYVAAGLVPIVSSNVRGAAYCAKEMGLGVVIEDEVDEAFAVAVKEAQVDKQAVLRFKQLTDEKESSNLLYTYYQFE